MNCAQFVARLPEGIRREVESEAPVAQRLRRGERLEEILIDTGTLIETASRFTEIERRVFMAVLLGCGVEPFDPQAPERFSCGGLSGAEAVIGLTGLRRRGVLFALRKTWGELLYALPFDTFGIWQRLLLPPLLPAHLSPDAKTGAVSPGGEYQKGAPGEASLPSASVRIDPVHPYRPGLLHDLFYCTAMMAKQEHAITQKGSLNKRQLGRLLSGISLQDGDVAGLDLRYAHSDSYPPAFACVLDMLLQLGWISAADAAYRVQPGPLGELLRLPEAAIQSRLYSLWAESRFPADPALQHLAALIEQLPYGAWFPLASLGGWLESVGLAPPAPDAAEVLSAFAASWLLPLCGCGWIELGRDNAGSGYFRWLCSHRLQPGAAEVSETDGGAEGNASVAAADRNPASVQRTLYIQPDLEIVVPPDTPYLVRWEVEAFADRVRSDRTVTYRLTRDSVGAAIEAGRDVESFLRFAGEHSLFGVPDNVQATLRQWGERFGQVRFAEAILLRCATALVADEIAGHPACAPLIAGRLGERDFIVSRAQLEPLRKQLEKAGLAPMKRLQSADGDDCAPAFPKLEPYADSAPSSGSWDDRVERTEREDSNDVDGTASRSGDFGPNREQGILYARNALAFYELEPGLPGMAEIYPGLEQLPGLWLSENRKYHASTERELIAAAIRYKAYIIEERMGLRMLFRPAVLMETSSGWKLSGSVAGEAMTLAQEEVGGLRLYLPGLEQK